MIYSNRVDYFSDKEVHQQLDILYSLEGDIDDIIDKLNELKSQYLTDELEVTLDINFYTTNKTYVDGTKTKKVKFDSLYLNMRDSEYDDCTVYCVVGVRGLLQEEKDAILDRDEKIKLAIKERDLKELERLKSLYDK